MLSFKNWFDYGANIGYISLNPSPDLCDMGFQIEHVEDVEKIDIDNIEYKKLFEINGWIEFGWENKWFTTGCIKHDLKPPFVYLDSQENAIKVNKNVMFTESKKESILELIKFAQKIKPSDSFLDIGCGPGFPMKLACENDYTFVEGIESVSKIYEKAVINLKDTNALVFCTNIKDYYLENKNQHIYFYNPFKNDVLTEFLERNINTIKQTDSLVLFQNCYRADHVFKLFGMKSHLSLDIDTQIYSF